MREDAKATRSAVALSLALGLLAFLALLLSASSALAATVTNERPPLFSFDGSDTSTGSFTQPEAITVNESTGTVYVLNTAGFGKGTGPAQNPAHRVVCKFDAEGNAENFSALGKACLDGSATPGGAFGAEGFFGTASLFTDVAVDNSGVNPGRLYINEAGGPTHAFNPDGSYLWTLPSSTVDSCGTTVDREGHLWVVAQESKKALEFASSGSPPAQIGSFNLAADKNFCRPGIDQTGSNFYVAEGVNGSAKVEKYVGGTHDSTLVPEAATRELTVDQSKATGHIFVTAAKSFTEFEPCAAPSCPDAEVAGSPFAGELLGNALGIAYNPTKDRVYVADDATETVKAFGPVTSGTAPDVAGKPTAAVGQHGATARATINPLGLNNSYHFELAEGGSVVKGLQVQAGMGTFKFTTTGPSPQSTDPLPFDVSAAVIQEALEGLTAIGPGNVSVSGTPATEETTLGEYDIAFIGALAKVSAIPLGVSSIDLSGYKGGSGGVTFSIKVPSPDWATASSSPAQSIEPTDGASHEVSFPLTGLTGNTTYSVRLVGVNADNHLRSVSVFDSFTTSGPPSPAVSIDSIAPITTTTAHIAATIDPHEDPTTWKVQKSTDPSCKTGFVDEPTQSIPSPGPGTVAVTWDLTGLLPAQTYCVRVLATNSGGTNSADKTIQTLAIAPTEASTAFAAPRTDTTARINGRVNPQGEADLTYRFEWSEDGSSWSALPDRLSTIDSRGQIVVADELSELKPATTYHYRLASVSSSGGTAAGLPAPEKTFTTRSSAELAQPASCPNEDIRAAQHATYLPDCRALELVNSPDKGNQNVFAQGPKAGGPALSADGNGVLWEVTAGAPGAPNGTLNSFFAKRSDAGWSSRPLAPPAEEQLEGGELAYRLSLATPDMQTYLFNAKRSTGVSSPEPPSFVRVQADRSQELLKRYRVQPINTDYEKLIDISDDGSHVIFPDNDTGQLEDIGDPGAEPELISRMPNGSPSACGLGTSIFAVSFAGPGGNGYHWIATSDASRIYFKVPPDANCAGTYGLYVRNREAAKTTLIDPGTGGETPEFIRASPDGRVAYFLTHSACRRFKYPQLSCELLEPADKNADPDVYRFDEESGKSSCLTCVVADANVSDSIGDTASTRGVLVSDDLSHLYFESTEQLLPGLGTQGDINLYALSGGKVEFVADVGDEVLGTGRFPRLSTDGNVLLFSAKASPALSADAVASQCINPSGDPPGPCQELYRYDDRDGSLECLSCSHSALTTHSFGTPFSTAFDFRLSADGTTVAFATQEALAAGDINQDTDIYEWRGGALGLLSDGVSDFPEEFTSPQVLAVGEHGRDILFGLAVPGGSPTGFERDGLLNLYDARVDGGFEPPSPGEGCEGDACQGPLAPPPSLPAGGGGFHGRGNPVEASPRTRRCGAARRRVVRKGKARCVKRRAKKHQAAHPDHRSAR